MKRPLNLRLDQRFQGRSTGRLVLIILLASASTFLSASEITGSVLNKSKNRPAVGDDVILLSLSNGMQETARTKTDADGKFHLAVSDEGVQHLIRVVHEGVNYHKAAPQGTSTVDVEVYDVAKQVDKIFGEGHVFRFQTSKGQLQVSEMYILRNESTPPRTRMSERSFEVTLPEGAEVDSGMAAGPGGMPVTSAPIPVGDKGHYAFVFPIRPGRTQFQITYHLSYSGNHSFDFKSDMSFAELGVMVPKTMQFKATGDSFQPASDESGMTTYVIKSVVPGQFVAFSISGEGTAPREAQDGPAASSGPPGGGLGVPIQGDNPIGSSTLWYVLGGLIVSVSAGAYFVARRPVSNEQQGVAGRVVMAVSPALDGHPTASSTRPMAQTTATTPRQESIKDILKEELFQIETEHLEGKISKQQYEVIRAGINALLRRHIAKQS